VQNVIPRFDRRLLAVVVGTLATTLALALNIDSYANFLALLGSTFVPLTAVLLVDYFVHRRHRWDVTEDAPSRWPMLLPWLLGMVTYWLINPGYVGWWVDRWTTVQGWLHFTPQTWMSASVLSFAVAAAATVLVAPFSRRTAKR
jgi:purine-cytosine permease-like protein